MRGRVLPTFFTLSVFVVAGLWIKAEDNQPVEAMDPETQEMMKAKEALSEMDSPRQEGMSYRGRDVQKGRKKNRSFTRAEAFVAGQDWEFDGFVAGGQDSYIKSMYVLNDLIYLNIGSSQGIEPGDQLSIYRRGARVRDPQTGKFMGFEVRRAAVSEATNKVEDDSCTARIIHTYEGVEIGDLVRRDE